MRVDSMCASASLLDMSARPPAPHHSHSLHPPLPSSCAHAACKNITCNQERTCVCTGTGQLGNSMITICSRGGETFGQTQCLPIYKNMVSLWWDRSSSDATASSAQPSQQQLALTMGMSRGRGWLAYPEARSHTRQGQPGGMTGSLLGCPPHA